MVRLSKEGQARKAKAAAYMQKIEDLMDRAQQEIEWWKALDGGTPGPFLIMNWMASLSNEYYKDCAVEHEKARAEYRVAALKERRKRAAEAANDVKRIMASRPRVKV